MYIYCFVELHEKTNNNFNYFIGAKLCGEKVSSFLAIFAKLNPREIYHAKCKKNEIREVKSGEEKVFDLNMAAKVIYLSPYLF